MLTSTLPGVEGLGKNNSSKFVRTPTKCCLLSSDHCFNGLGFIYGCLLNIYVGSQLIIIPPFDYYANPANWFNAIYKLNGRTLAKLLKSNTIFSEGCFRY